MEKYFRSIFGSSENFKICFRDYLTFRDCIFIRGTWSPKQNMDRADILKQKKLCTNVTMIFYVTNYVTKPWQTSVIFHGHHLLLYYIVVRLHSVVAVSKCTYLL